jgi:truncated hemoglobin YjbI
MSAPPFRAAAETNPLIAAPVKTGEDTVKDWLQHYTYGRYTWGEAVAEFYRRAAADPEIAAYFHEANMERLQRHFTAAMIMVTGSGVRMRTVERMAQVHAGVRTVQGRPITGDVYDRTVSVLVTILQEWGVPQLAITDLARIVGLLRSAVVNFEG